jgi:hypothetical protein
MAFSILRQLTTWPRAPHIKLDILEICKHLDSAGSGQNPVISTFT